MATRRSDPGQLLEQGRFLDRDPSVSGTESANDRSRGAQIDGSAVVQSGAGDYALLRAGKIDLEEYLSLTVDRAVAHLSDQLPEEQVEAMRQVLRSSLQNDPQLAALAERVATGA